MILRPEIRDLISALQREIEVLRAENATLRQEVAELRRQLDKNSSNSSKPHMSRCQSSGSFPGDESPAVCPVSEVLSPLA